MKVRGKSPYDTPDYVYKSPKTEKPEGPERGGSGIERKQPVEEKAFARKLEEASGRQERQALDALLGEIQEEGKRLAARPTLAALEKFKKMVKGFLDSAMAGAYKLKVTRSSSEASQQKLYLVVEQVDARLAELSQQVVSGQRDALRILATVDALRGLLMDLYT